MRVLPVIDVRHGSVVRATGGDRAAYAVWESDLCPTGEPLPMVFALQERFGFTEVYLADIGALEGGLPDLELVCGLKELGIEAWVDAGVRDAAEALAIRTAGGSVVVGSESIASPAAWQRTMQTVDSRRIAFSLDLRDGKVIAPGWGEEDPEALVAQVLSLAAEVHGYGPARLFVIDLARIGSGRGVGTEMLLNRLARQYPEVEVYAGGGIRDANDLRRLEQLGVAGALVASALHDGTFQPRRQS